MVHYGASRDRWLLYGCAFIRAAATSMLAIVVPLYFAKLDFTSREIGAILSAGLGGAALASILVTFWGDTFGRKKTLMFCALVTAGGCGALIFVQSPILMGVVAFFGMLNGMGKDRGAALVLEQAILPHTILEEERTRAFAFYNIVQDIGHAIGALLASAPLILRSSTHLTEVDGFRVSMAGYALLMIAAAVLYLGLSRSIEMSDTAAKKMSASSKSILWKISSLFAIDAVAGGFLSASLLSYFFYKKFGVDASEIGALFFVARILNAMSHYGAAFLAKRIGLVNTMVFTHIPSSLLLMTVPFAPNFWVAAMFFLLREGLVEMDVPTRQSYVMVMVKPEERTFASGITHLVRMGGWAIAPMAAGSLMAGVGLSTPIFICGAMKISYDILLYFAFRGARPPEEIR